jgi:hypothetical protein
LALSRSSANVFQSHATKYRYQEAALLLRKRVGRHAARVFSHYEMPISQVNTKARLAAHNRAGISGLRSHERARVPGIREVLRKPL